MVKTERVTIYDGKRRGGRKVWRATLGDLEATGGTMAEARDAVLALAAVALEGRWLPATIVYCDSYATVYRDLQGWGYIFGSLDNLKSGAPTYGTHISCSGDSRDKVIQSAKKHLAQAAYPATNGLDVLTAHPPVSFEVLGDHLRWICFQRAYAHVRDELKYTDNEAHTFACGESGNVVWLTREEQDALFASEASDLRRTRTFGTYVPKPGERVGGSHGAS
jgi:hypothetical protein